MIAQRTGAIKSMAKSNAVEEAMNVLAHSRVTVRRWVCEVCGMVHTGSAPHECESCGVSALVQQPDLHREMSSHWYSPMKNVGADLSSAPPIYRRCAR